MKNLLISATHFEVQAYLSHFKFQQINDNLFECNNQQVLITGIGLAETTFQLTTFLCQHQVSFILQAGVAGAYSQNLSLGQVVEVVSEQYGDLGAEDHQSFLPVSHLQLPQVKEQFHLPNSATYQHLPAVHGISVNATAGNQNTISERIKLFSPDVESMEGLALFRVGLAHQLPFAQVRAISNCVEPRNKANWQMQLALTHLNQFLIQYCKPEPLTD